MRIEKKPLSNGPIAVQSGDLLNIKVAGLGQTGFVVIEEKQMVDTALVVYYDETEAKEFGLKGKVVGLFFGGSA